MSELADRMEVEADFAAKLSRLSSRQRRELRDKLGTPPDPRNVTPEDWERWERERRSILLLLLLGVSLSSAEQHAAEVEGKNPQVGDITTAARSAARDWSIVTSRDLAQQQVQNIRGSLADKATAWVELQQAGSVPEDLIDGDLVDVIGPRWDANTAASYTTAGNSAGINGTREAAGAAGVPMVLRWFTQADARVCPTCGPLHRKVVDLWELVLRNTPGGQRAIQQIAMWGGPPAHQNCRCFTELVPMREPIGALTP